MSKNRIRGTETKDRLIDVRGEGRGQDWCKEGERIRHTHDYASPTDVDNSVEIDCGRVC